MKVKAVKGVRVPMENTPHKYISDDQVVEVEETTYYLRRIADGDLIIETSQAVKNEQKSAKNQGGE